MSELYSYAVEIRRKLHEYPEIGFNLPRTTELVCSELDKIGIPYTTEYGVCSVAAEIGQGEKIIALRADMEALPVDEKVDVPFCSKIPGAMHACGHDSHTATILAVAKYLKAHESELPCKVRFIFQPSEEGAISGAKMMVDNGVMDGVDHIICTHCENTLEAGKIGVHSGDYMAACIPTTIKFIGKTTHAAIPQNGVDAVAMAVEAYTRFKEMVREEAGDRRYIWSVGRFSGGHVHNVVADLCVMDISFRFYDMEFAERVEKRVKAICKEIADSFGGKYEIDWHMSVGHVHNKAEIVDKFMETSLSAGLDVCEMPSRMTSEDFGWYLTKVPGMIFRFGTRNEAEGCTTTAHTNTFKIDENGMKYAINAFISYIMNFKEE